MLFMGKTQQLVDVTVVNPTCPSHVDKAQKQLAVAEHAAQVKIKKYKEMAWLLKTKLNSSPLQSRLTEASLLLPED